MTTLAALENRLVLAFNRGHKSGAFRNKYGRLSCPYAQTKPLMREAWFAGYDEGFKHG